MSGRGARPRAHRLAGSLLALATGLVVAATGCSTADADHGEVVVTTNILGDITRNIIGDQAEVTVLMRPNADPHSFGISAREAALVERAGLLVHNGLGLEEGMLRHVAAAEESGVPVVSAGDHADPIDYTSDESRGEPDPHFWTDPVRVVAVVEEITDRVVEHVDGVDEEAVRANADAYRAELEALHEEMAERFAEIPVDRRQLVTNHHVFGYLAERYDFEVVGAVIPSGTTLASPSASDLESLAGAVRDAGVPAIFADSSQPDRLAQVLADHVGLDVAVVPLFSESLSAEGEGAETYLDMMRANTDSISQGLLGQL
ncbi:zinc ABC transporter substrate-binding protein AztC [Actinoalloteichus caeruleus]|uniref:zinc ABC transporter substrate-binding protein AztC n=1 Tax=Actinoalloteichus cyanogriseus TaxID=2893586 RepID=UPI0004ABC8C6|nr:zinc ABC transporter substrate-binding protein AztC [Actinoalloteichus caeruleus]